MLSEYFINLAFHANVDEILPVMLEHLAINHQLSPSQNTNLHNSSKKLKFSCASGRSMFY